MIAFCVAIILLLVFANRQIFGISKYILKDGTLVALELTKVKMREVVQQFDAVCINYEKPA